MFPDLKLPIRLKTHIPVHVANWIAHSNGLDYAADDPQAEPRRGPEPPPPDWKDVVFKAIEMTAQEEWARLADVGNGTRKADSSFDTRAYGSRTLLSLVMTIPERFEVREEKHEGHPPVHYMRAVRS